MNKRIQEMAEQAGIVIPKDSEYNGHIYRNSIEKFAKLIVQECIQVMHKQESMPAGFLYAKGATIHEVAIREHFGVEA
jgi:hypothetical protein